MIRWARSLSWEKGQRLGKPLPAEKASGFKVLTTDNRGRFQEKSLKNIESQPVFCPVLNLQSEHGNALRFPDKGHNLLSGWRLSDPMIGVAFFC